MYVIQDVFLICLFTYLLIDKKKNFSHSSLKTSFLMMI